MIRYYRLEKWNRIKVQHHVNITIQNMFIFLKNCSHFTWYNGF